MTRLYRLVVEINGQQLETTNTYEKCWQWFGEMVPYYASGISADYIRIVHIVLALETNIT